MELNLINHNQNHEIFNNSQSKTTCFPHIFTNASQKTRRLSRSNVGLVRKSRSKSSVGIAKPRGIWRQLNEKTTFETRSVRAGRHLGLSLNVEYAGFIAQTGPRYWVLSTRKRRARGVLALRLFGADFTYGAASFLGERRWPENRDRAFV